MGDFDGKFAINGIWEIPERNYKLLIQEIRDTGAVADLDRYGNMVLADPVDLQDIIDDVEYEKRTVQT